MKILSDKGVSTIAALLALLSLAAMGNVVAFMAASNQTSRADYLSSYYALYVAQAGTEYAVKRVYDQQSEIVNPPGMTFGPGSFTVSRSGLTLTITGTVGNAVRVFKVDSPTEADCTDIDTSNLNLHGGGKEISQITFKKVCLTSITVDKMQFTWTPNTGQKLIKIKIESSVLYDDPIGSSSGTLIDVADYTAATGNNNVINEIKFNQSVEDADFTMSWTMGDNSIKTVTFKADD